VSASELRAAKPLAQRPVIKLLDCRLQSLSRTTNLFAARNFRAEMLFTSAMPTHAEKNRGRRVLFHLKRANIAAFGLYDRAAGRRG
jgi:hypothetical protein